MSGQSNRNLGALLLLLAAPAAAQDSRGISIATFAVARDSASAQQAAVTDFLVRQSFQRNPRYAVLDVEGFLATGTPIQARDQMQRALAQLDKGRQMYDAFELDPAIATLTDSVIAFERGAAALTDMGPYVRALQLLGATHMLKADKKSARNAFERALLVDPGATLQGGGYPPTVLEAYDAAREAVKAIPLASLSVYSNPAAAEVYIDGIFRGATPLTVQRLPAGRHVVRVYRAGYLSFGKISDLLEGTESTLQASLKPTAQAAQFEGLLRRAAPEAAQDGAGAATQELGAWLKVDQLLVVQVTASGNDVTLQAAHTDAAGGARLHAATRTFSFSSQRYRSDVEEFIVGEFRQAQLGVTQGTGTGDQVGTNYAPRRPDRPVHPGFVWGGVSIGAGALFLLTGIGFTIPAVNINNKLARLPQIDANSGKLRSEGQIYFGVAVAGYALTAATAVAAVILFAIAGTEEESVETILQTPGGQ
ncbi:MAG: PEGA domain-containing protein [Deltaproteobacteria bacterium]|nr:PEGA domain-containing protein [Deltaproteobacteria bacterium]